MIYKKKVLWLMAIAIIMVIVSVACSGNPTNAGDYIVAKQAEQSPKPEMKLTVDTNQGLIQFKDLSFKSGAYYINGNYTKKIYYYADIKVDENSKPYISAITKSEDGEIIEDEGKFYVMSNESGTFYKLSGVRYQSGNTLTAEATFNESGYLVIRFSNYSLDITYSLLNEKAPEEIVDEISDGSYIPKIYHGHYVYLSGDNRIRFADVYPHLHNGEYVDGITYDYTEWHDEWIWLVNDSWNYYWGNNWWEQSIWNAPNNERKFSINERGQRILGTTGWRVDGVNNLVHEDDVNK